MMCCHVFKQPAKSFGVQWSLINDGDEVLTITQGPEPHVASGLAQQFVLQAGQRLTQLPARKVAGKLLHLRLQSGE
jgi:hypothetical protein